LHCIEKRSRIFDVYFNVCGENQVASLVLTFVYYKRQKKLSLRFVKHFQFHIIAFVNMECKENDVNDADIDDRFPADIEKAANRATLTFINK
jgi:hypothetical protein